MLVSEKNGLAVIGDICIKDKSSNRAKILEYEELAKTLPQVDIPVTHHIHGGMYGREITIPKGTVLTGMIYKFDHFDIMISGDITVSTDTGETKRLTGFNLFKGMSGKKRAGYAHEDTHWVTFHPFDGIDGEELQKAITASDFNELEDFYIEINRADYLDMVDSIGMTQEEIREQVENTDDMTDLEPKFNHLYVAPSKIEGKGFFSVNKINSGDIICPARVNNLRTNGGRYCNHAVYANADILLSGTGGANLIATRDIEIDEEITVNYKQILEHRAIKGDLCRG